MILPHDDLGSGPVILLLHAGVVDRRMWSEQLKPLSEAGYRVIALDLPGFGEAPMAVEQDAPWLDVLETLDWLGVERVALVGNSFGGLVAQRIAALAPARLWALVLVSSPDDALWDVVGPSPRLQKVWAAEEAALEMEDLDLAVQITVDAWTLPQAPARLRLSVAKMQRRAYELRAQDGVTPEGPDPLESDPGALERLELPTLVVWGEHDMSDFHESSERLAGRVPGARSTVIAGAGHLAPMERAKAFRDELLGFLEQAGGA